MALKVNYIAGIGVVLSASSTSGAENSLTYDIHITTLQGGGSIVRNGVSLKPATQIAQDGQTFVSSAPKRGDPVVYMLYDGVERVYVLGLCYDVDQCGQTPPQVPADVVNGGVE